LLYHTGHIPGAIKIDWVADLNDPVMSDYLGPDEFARLMSKSGIGPDSTVVFYGDNFNWWAAYALWVFELFGHADTRLLDGGRAKWVAEGRPLSTDTPDREAADYPKPTRDDRKVRAFLSDVLPHSKERKPLIDVRSPEEYRGERLHMPDYPNEGALRGGHIPGAKSVPWKKAANEDNTFKSAEELKTLYVDEAGLAPGDDVIAYCRIGERSAHTWFVLTHLLGFERVRNYDGSWTEYGNAVRVPIEKP
jgi:thiosulfate/3-mercaptopyruvate sulfurtransferase